MNNFTLRTITGIGFVAVLSGSILFSAATCLLLFFLIVFLGMKEFYGLVEVESIKPQKNIGIAAGLLLLFVFAAPHFNELNFNPQFNYIFYPLVFLIFILELFRDLSKPFSNIAYTLLGIVYIALPFSLLYTIAFNGGTYNSHLIIGYFILLWTSDSGAYVTGMKFGKHKLFERISPKKTWEGSAGGMLLAMITSYLLSLFFHELNLIQWMILALIVVVTGTLGDLVESMLKRSLGVKDSGTILPGHGGILDRFDAVLVSAPFVFFYIYCCCSS